MRRKNYFFVFACALITLASVPRSALAASVSAVKDKRVMINLDGEAASEGEEFFLINPATGKRAALIRIRQVKGTKALGDLLRGRALPGFTLQAKESQGLSADVTSAAAAPSLSIKNSYGFLGGYLMNSMTADVSFRDSFNVVNKATASMSGSGFAAGAFYDYVFSPSLVLRGYSGIEQFNVEGQADKAACAGSTDCNAKINYLALYGLLKWYPTKGTYRFWLGGGMGYLLALSKSSTALNEAQISTNQVFTGALGLDIQRSSKAYIPISLEYNMFPASDTVKASSMLLRFGYGWNIP